MHETQRQRLWRGLIIEMHTPEVPTETRDGFPEHSTEHIKPRTNELSDWPLAPVECKCLQRRASRATQRLYQRTLNFSGPPAPGLRLKSPGGK